MPSSVVFILKPYTRVQLPPTTGPALHGAFFSWLSQIEAGLATELHDLKSMKPFTVSDIQPLRTTSNSREFTATNPGWFRITSLDERLDRVLIGRNLPAEVEILNERFKVEHICRTPTEHSWANCQSWDELTASAATLTEKNGFNRKFWLGFHSPTTFKAAGRAFPLPLPEQVFNSLLTRWNSFSPYRIEVENLCADLAISGYDLATHLVWMEGSRQGSKLLCFTGWCEYTLFSNDKRVADILKALTNLAFYAGVGYKTSMGFGQIALHPPGGSSGSKPLNYR
jgi:CRISPR-associated endoribonuclease Cas6